MDALQVNGSSRDVSLNHGALTRKRLAATSSVQKAKTGGVDKGQGGKALTLRKQEPIKGRKRGSARNEEKVKFRPGLPVPLPDLNDSTNGEDGGDGSYHGDKEVTYQFSKRQRKSSCDELKGMLIKQTSQSSSSARGCGEASTWDGSEFSLSLSERTKRGPSYNFRHSTTALLTDFERFVMENRGRHFEDTCFPARIGEECNICDTTIKTDFGTCSAGLSEASCGSSTECDSKVSLRVVGNRLYSVSSFSSVKSRCGDTHTEPCRRRPVRQLSSFSDGSDSQESCPQSESSGSDERDPSADALSLRVLGNRLCSLSSFSSLDSHIHKVSNKTVQSKQRKRRLSSMSDEEYDSHESAPKPKCAKENERNRGLEDSHLHVDLLDTNKNSSRVGVTTVGRNDRRSLSDLSTETRGWSVPPSQDSRDKSSEGESDSRSHSQTGREAHSETRVEWSSLCRTVPDWMYVAIDCEMVGTGPKGRVSALGRCSIVDYQGNVVYDKFVRPDAPVTDYRTKWSGIRPSHLTWALSTSDALEEIHGILDHKIIIGHSVYNDFRVLNIRPPFYTVRDTAQCKTLVRLAGLEGQGNSLKKLTGALLDRSIQMSSSGHCSVEDARATLDLFKLVRQDYEAELYGKWAKKGEKQILNALVGFIETAHWTRGLRYRADSIGDSKYLEDEYWPSDATDDTVETT